MSWEYLDHGFQILFHLAKSNANFREVQKYYEIKHDQLMCGERFQNFISWDSNWKGRELALVLHNLDS